MNRIHDFLDANHRTVTIAGCTIAAVAVATIVIRRLRKTRSVEPIIPDVVILHQVGRGPFAPSISPFALKMETFLRMAGIPYKNRHGRGKSPKGKWPWIVYNGEIVSDTSFIIQYLNGKFGVDVNKHLSSPERAVARAFQKMVEENLFWGLALFRFSYGYDQPIFKMVGLGYFLQVIFARGVMKAAWYQGIGRHTKQEVQQIIVDDLKALSDFLGQKKFLFGDVPCETDTTVFGMLAQINWHADGTPICDLFKKDFPNLVNYCNTMKDTFWPDWDQCITHGGTQKASH